MRPSTLHLLSLLSLLTTTLARTPPTSFCKCICFTNSTIIPLNASPQSQSQSTSTSRSNAPQRRDEDASAQRRLTCNDCTKAFCLDSDLAICQGAKEEDVFTSCFQRDSLKDETIVLLFVVMTSGLLGWAVLRPWVDKFLGSDTVQRYAPVGNLDLGALRRGGGGSGGRGLPAYRDGADSRHRSRGSGGSESFARQGGLNS